MIDSFYYDHHHYDGNGDYDYDDDDDQHASDVLCAPGVDKKRSQDDVLGGRLRATTLTHDQDDHHNNHDHQLSL